MYNGIDDNTWVEDHQWIGIVRSWDRKPNVTLITPLAYYVDQKWRTVSSHECNKYFPNNGKVARFNLDFPQRKIERLLSFYPVFNQKPAILENDPQYSFYLTFSDLDFVSLGQILDWNYRTRELFDLPALLEQGINAEDCLSYLVYVRYRDSLYGPIHLEADRINPRLLKPREYLLGSSTDGQPLFGTEYPFDKNSIITVESTSFVSPNRIGSSLGRVDLSLPQVVMKKVLRVSNTSTSPDLAHNVHLSRQKIADLAYLSSSNGPEALQIDASTLTRAQYIVQHQINNLHNLQALLEELPRNHPLLHKARILEIEQRKCEIEQEALLRSEFERNRLQTLQEQVQAKEQRLQALQEQAQTTEDTLAEREEEIEQAVQKYERIQADFGTLERSMQQRLAALRQEPLQLLADLQLITALPSSLFQPLSGIATDNLRPEPIASSGEHARFFTDEDASGLSISDGTLKSLPWKEAAKGGQAPSDEAEICAVALLAGLIPAPNGPVAADVWYTVARVLTEGRVWFVPVPLTALSPLDLFGSIVPQQRLFLPAAGEFADILLEASAHPTQLAIVILEGIDRIPFLPVVAPLLQVYRRTRQNVQQGVPSPRHFSSLNLFHPQALTSDDPYQRLSTVTWPENLLLGATFDDEVSSLPLPLMYTSWFVHTEPKGTKRASIGNQKDWQIASNLWYKWEKELFTSANNDQREDWPEHFDQWQRQFYVAMEDLDIKKREDRIERIWPEQS